MRTLGSENGQSLMIVLLCIVILLGFVALATDVGILFYTKRQLQSIADSAAIGGASVIPCNVAGTGGSLASGCPSVIMAAQIDAQGGVTTGANGTSGTVLGNGVTLFANHPPVYGPKAGNSNYVEAIACQNAPVFFMNLFMPVNNSCTGGTTSWTGKLPVTARSVAFWGAGQGCLYTLGTSGTTIFISGSSINLQATQCGIYDNSSASNAIFISGSSDTINAKSIGVVGDKTISGSNDTITPTPVSGIVPVSDPLVYLSPPSAGTCSGSLIITSSMTVPAGYCSLTISGSGYTVTIPAGTYSGGITISGSTDNVTFNTGTYILSSGSLTVSGSSDTVSGNGVTFYVAGTGAVIISGSSNTFNLTAPTSGTYNGILFFQDRSDSASDTIGGSTDTLSLYGALYFPDAALTISGSTVSSNLYVDLIVKSVTFSGSSITLKDYATLSGVTSPVGAATLVE